MGEIDELLVANQRYVRGHGHQPLPTAPRRQLAILSCMDSRLDLFGALGLSLGDCHLVRNAGGLASDDAVRSLILSQRLLGTTSVMVIHHTRCGLEGLDEPAFVASLTAEVGVAPATPFGAINDIKESVRAAVQTLAASPFLSFRELRGFVYDVDEGTLIEVH